MSVTRPIHGFGGSAAAALGFKIVAYNTIEDLKASAPADYTIGIVTSEKIVSWCFSAAQPQDQVPGTLWVMTGRGTVVSFNALKRNCIEVCPICAKQLDGAAWVDRPAMIRLAGAWEEWWNGELYATGNEFPSITGGWVEYSGNTSGANIEYTSNCLKLKTGTHGTNSSVETKNLIDMSDFSVLVLSGEIKSSTTHCGWGVRDEDGNQAAFTTSEYSIDISNLSGMYRPFLRVRNSSEYITMEKMQMQR